MTAEERKERERIAAEFRPVVVASLKTFPLLKAFTDGLMARHLVAPSNASRKKRVAPKKEIKETRRALALQPNHAEAKACLEAALDTATPPTPASEEPRR